MLISDNLYKYFNERIIKKVGINMFDLDVVNAFSKGTVIILKSYFNSKVLKGDVRIYRNANHVGGVIVFIGITGDLSGRLMFNMSKSTAFKLASALNSESITNIDDIFVSTIKEFVNIVAGSAINDLYTKHIDLDMTPPAILMSEQIAMLEKENDKILSINYKTEFGDIFMNLILFNQSKS